MSKKKEIPKRGGGRPPVYPWRDLGVGDSFFIPGAQHGSISGSLHNATKRLGMRFVVRQEMKDGELGLRVYRKS